MQGIQNRDQRHVPSQSPNLRSGLRLELHKHVPGVLERLGVYVHVFDDVLLHRGRRWTLLEYV